MIYFFFRKFVVIISCLLFDLLLMNIFPFGSAYEYFGVFSHFPREIRIIMVYSPYLFALYIALCINHYCWFLSGNFSFNFILALPPNAFFCWLKFSPIICGFPEREPSWSGGGGRLQSNCGVSRCSRQRADSGVRRGAGWKLVTNSSLTWGRIF